MATRTRAQLLKFATVSGLVKQYRRALEAMTPLLRDAEGDVLAYTKQPTAKEMFTKSENLFHGTKNVDAVMADGGKLLPLNNKIRPVDPGFVENRVFYGAGSPEREYLGYPGQEGFIIPKSGVPSARHIADDRELLQQSHNAVGNAGKPWAVSDEALLPRNTTAVLDTSKRGKQAVQDFQRKNKMRVIDSRVLADALVQRDYAFAPRPATKKGILARYGKGYDNDETLAQVVRQVERRKK